MTEKREYTDDYQDRTLYTPGSTGMREDVITEMCQPMFGYRMDRMTDLYATIVKSTKEFFSMDNDVMILMGSGTETWEPSMLNLVDENTLVPTYEGFGERHANITERFGRNADRIEYKWGQVIEPEDVREALESSGKQYDVVAIVMNESLTGVRNPVEEIGNVVAEYPNTYLVVDAMSALDGDYADVDEHSIDVIFTPSQKAFIVPPGLAICTINDEAYKRELSKDPASWYGGSQHALGYYDRKGQTHSTPAVPIVLAYCKQMKHMLEGNHEDRDKRHHKMIGYICEWACEHFDAFPEEGYESQIVAHIENTRGIDVATTTEEVDEEYDMAFSNGYGPTLGERTLRIGYMGEHNVESTKALTDAIEDVVDL